MCEEGGAVIRVVAAQVVGPYVLDVTFNDGTRREVDLEAELWGEVFLPLRDPAFFAQAAVDPVLGTVVWQNEADFSPEFLYYGDERNPYAEPPGAPIAEEPAAAPVGPG